MAARAGPGNAGLTGRPGPAPLEGDLAVRSQMRKPVPTHTLILSATELALFDVDDPPDEPDPGE